MKNGKPFFDRNIFPIEDMNAEKYTRKCADSSVCHIFEKILKLKDQLGENYVEIIENDMSILEKII